MAHVLAITDNQSPFDHPDALPFLLALKKYFNTDTVVHLGDEADFHALSAYTPDPDGFSPGHEIEAAIQSLEKYYQAFPNVAVCESNHTDRIAKRAYRAGLPASAIKPLKEILRAPKGWEWRERWWIDGVNFEHGHQLFGRWSSPKTALRRAVENRGCSTVFGHMHSCFGVYSEKTLAGRKFAACGGCLVDEDAYAFAYGKGKHNIQHGALVVMGGVPLAIPMRLDKNKRWNGNL